MKTLCLGFLSLILGSCTSPPTRTAVNDTEDQILSEKNPKSLGPTSIGQEIPSGGYSGLLFHSRDTATGKVKLWSITDRGPNAEALGKKRPFLMPQFTPAILELELEPSSGSFQVLNRIPLVFSNSRPATGLPNSSLDEVPVGLSGQNLKLDLSGIDPEGITRDSEGFFWICEEYRPSLLKVNMNGEILARYIPKGSLNPDEMAQTKSLNFKPLLPQQFSQRHLNRGFEGITFHRDYLVVSLQSPTGQKNKLIPWLVFHPKTKKTKLVFYPAESSEEKIGDLHSQGDAILTIDQSKKIHKVEMPFAFDQIVPESLVAKQLVINLGNHSHIAKSFDHEKIEGLTQISPEVFALINDNDFGLSGKLTFSNGIAELQKDPKSEILLLKNVQKR